MAMEDAKPTDSPLGMAIASNALLAEIIQILVDNKVINRIQLMNAIATARRRVNTVPDRSEHHAAADGLLDTLQKRFPVA
jgi:hypothetical protein